MANKTSHRTRKDRVPSASKPIIENRPIPASPPSAYSRLLNQHQSLLLDGAMGTQLFLRGLAPGDSPEQLNLVNPGIVQAIHTEYLNVGSDIILTNTFGGNRHRLALHNLGHKVHEVNNAAVRIAKQAALEFESLVAGSIGPLGELLVPLGPISAGAAFDAFQEQISGLTASTPDRSATHCVDLLWIETMSSLDEAVIAIQACRQLTELPVAVTMSFDTHHHTMMGVSPADATNALLDAGASAVGLNCGNSLDDNESVITEMRRAAPDATLIAKPNAGVPEWRGAELAYSGTPTLMADFARRLRHSGVQLIGGCCGTTPDHISAMRSALAELGPRLSA
jgi:methionine synthase I (cobalamin-dependent)